MSSQKSIAGRMLQATEAKCQPLTFCREKRGCLQEDQKYPLFLPQRGPGAEAWQKGSRLSAWTRAYAKGRA